MGSNFLTFLSFTQIVICVQILYLSFYQILILENIMDIYTSAAGLLFVNSFSNFAGLFFKKWIRDLSGFGLRLLCAETYYRSHFEILSKSVMVATIVTVWYNCLYNWLQYNDRVIFRNIKETYLYDDWRSDLSILAIGITLITLPLLY